MLPAMAELSFHVLGPLRVVGTAGQHLKVPSPAQRRLLSLLIMRSGTAISADVLADRLDLSPGALRTSISRLRRTIGAETLVTAPPGYQLSTEAVDSRRFEALLTAARASTDPDAVRSSLEAALRLWRGEAYGEFAHEPWAVAEAWRLTEARAGAVESLAEILLDLGKWTEAIVHLELLIAEHPLRDRPRALLMRSLADSGRRAEALRAFHAYRRLLIEETGLEPSEEIVALERAIASAPAPEVEQPAGTVTFLLAEVDSSTGPGAPCRSPADVAVRQYYELLDEAIALAGGVRPVEQGVGESVIGAFVRPGDALAAAVSSQLRLVAELPGLPIRMALHTSAAELRGAGRHVGGAVPEGERLRTYAHGGQILVSDGTAAALERHHFPEGTALLELGPAPFAGAADRRPVWQVTHPGLPASFPPLRLVAPRLPGPLAAGSRAVVVGRDAELAAIANAARRVADGEGPGVLLISGEAGVGKTTVMAEAARRLFEGGACVVFGHCEEELATPYQLFAQALDHLVAQATDEQLAAHVASHGAQLTRLVPGLAPRLPDAPGVPTAADADAERYLLFAAVVGLLRTFAELQPVVLVFDDLQWADPGSLQLLCHLTGSARSTRLFVLGVFRDPEPPRGRSLGEALATLHRQLAVTRLELDGLDEPGVVAIMEARAGHALDATAVNLAQAVQRETDGNPFFVTQVLRHLFETGRIARDASGRWEARGSIDDIGLPTSVREVIAARVARLGPVAGKVLALAAVIGREFDFDTLAQMVDVAEEDLLDVLAAATSSALLRERQVDPGHFVFAHALIRHTLYTGLGATRRALSHEQVGKALEALWGDHPEARITELARHWSQAPQPQHADRAVAYARMAADSALAALAPDEALGFYRQALEILSVSSAPDLALVIDLSIGLGTAQRQIGEPSYRDTLLDAARRAADLGDSARVAAAALANDRGFFSVAGGVDTEKIAVLEMALAGLPAGRPERALLLANLCQELTYASPLPRRRSLADEALALASAAGDHATIVRVSNNVYDALRVPSELDAAVRRTADAMARAELVGDPLLLFWAAVCRHEVAANAGDIDELDRCLGVAGSLADQLDQPILHWVHTYQRANRAVFAGDSDVAERLATEALQLGSDCGQPDAATFFAGLMFHVIWQRGQAADSITFAEAFAAEHPDMSFIGPVLAVAHAEGGRTAQARRLLDAGASAQFGLPQDLFWATGLCGYAEAAVLCRAPEHAQILIDLLSPWVGQCACTGATSEGPISRYVGGLAAVLGRYDEASDLFARSAAFCARTGAEFFACRTDLWWGATLLERGAPGDVEKARDLLAKARAAAAMHGYAFIERTAIHALRQVE
jgi:DNA-binding SARP family transcriptional activator